MELTSTSSARLQGRQVGRKPQGWILEMVIKSGMPISLLSEDTKGGTGYESGVQRRDLG